MTKLHDEENVGVRGGVHKLFVQRYGDKYIED
jgi:hypothetical protein